MSAYNKKEHLASLYGKTANEEWRIYQVEGFMPVPNSWMSYYIKLYIDARSEQEATKWCEVFHDMEVKKCFAVSSRMEKKIRKEGNYE